MKKGIIISLALTVFIALAAETAAGQTKDPLLFPKENFTVETKTVKTSAGEKKVTYRSYMHIQYLANPVDKDYQSMNVSVPIKVDDSDIDATNAPVLFVIGVGGYMSVNNARTGTGSTQPGGMGGSGGPGGQGGRGGPGATGNVSGKADLALAAGYVVVLPGCRGRDNKAADGTFYGKAPSAIVDLKAAIRYIRHNKNIIPGNVDWIFSTGVSAGGALSALLGASGNSPLYDSYLKEIGAAEANDNIFASACFCPITDLEHADGAYEWMYGSTPGRSGLVDQELSKQLKAINAEYQASLNLKGKDRFGTLTAENYDKYLLQYYLVPSANKYLKGLTDEKRNEYLTSNKWITWTDKGASFLFADYVTHVGRMKGLPAFDDFNMKQPEPVLFGNKTTEARHFTNFSLRQSSGNKNAAIDNEVKTLVNLMNAMYFTGQNNGDCAGHWWLRQGSSDNHTSQTVMANLAASLENRNREVNAFLYWDAGHGADQDAEDFIAWMGNVTGYSGMNKAGINPSGLKCENLDNPQVVDILKPRLSWVNIAGTGERGQVQTAWEIRVAATMEKLMTAQADLWNSGKVNSAQSFNVVYDGQPLTTRQECWWQVRTWDKSGKVSEWSKPAFWIMGLLNQGEWKAQWIGAPWQGEEPIPDPVRNENRQMVLKELPPPAPLLRKKIDISKELKSARAFVTGLGYFEFYVNGARVSDDVLVPNQTNYGRRPGLEKAGIPLPDDFREYRVMYLSYDITSHLKKGENVLGAIVGNGFYNAPMNWTESYGTPRFIGQIYITYTDGTEDIILTDESWKASKSPIVMDLIYQGEHYDARLEQPGWSAPRFDDSKWENVVLRKKPEGIMKAQMSPADKVMERIKPLAIIKNSDGKYYVDFGQEISGWIRISGVQGKAGSVIDFDYICESTNGDNTYTLKGVGPESYAARFTWFVFRQVVISNWPGNLSADQITAEAVYTNVETSGKFETSNPLFNSINRIWWRSQTDNMHGAIASDCPHRERSPYTGDGQVACVTVMHNFDSKAFYTKWIHDIVGAQIKETGYIPNGAPWQPGCGGGVAWGAAVNIMPWEYYLHYADTSLLAYSYDAMKGYIRYMLTWTDKDGIMNSQRTGNNGQPLRWFNLGDWCAPSDLPPDIMVHTFYLWRGADFTSKAAKVLGNELEAKEYAAIAERTKQAFLKKFYNAEKETYGRAGGNIFALVMGVPAGQKQKVTKALRSDIASDGGHLDTGIFGTQFFFEVLADNGMQDLAYAAMNKKTQPSYGWWIEQGATTSWEQWDGSGSRNHPMFGGGIVWFYRKLAGMNSDIENPGYRNIVFRPQPVADLKFASYSNLTPFGAAGIRWENSENQFTMNVEVPVGSAATVYMPAEPDSEILENGKPVKNGNENITFIGKDGSYTVFKIKSGAYKFSSEMTSFTNLDTH